MSAKGIYFSWFIRKMFLNFVCLKALSGPQFGMKYYRIILNMKAKLTFQKEILGKTL